MDIGTMIPILIILIAVFFVVSKLNLGPKIKCNRCDGTGDIDERWHGSQAGIRLAHNVGTVP